MNEELMQAEQAETVGASVPAGKKKWKKLTLPKKGKSRRIKIAVALVLAAVVIWRVVSGLG